MKLPELVNGRKGAFLYFAIGVAATLVLYQFTNRIHFTTPRFLEMSSIDHVVPLVPWTIWLYFTEYLIFIVSWLSIVDDLGRTKYFLSYMAILLVSVAIFIFFPTTFPRENFPLDSFSPSISVDVFRFFRENMDTPANCAPSLHVSTCFIAAFVFWERSKLKFLFFFIWSTIVSISTLTTKQHYFIDIWTAVLLVFVCYYIFHHWVEYYPIKNKEPYRDGRFGNPGAANL